MTDATDELTYTVPRISCSSCQALITEELGELERVETVDVDLASRTVTVRGSGVEDAEIRSLLDELGYSPA